MKKCTVIILNYNGKQLLERNLPAVMRSAYDGNCTVVVADNNSTDGSVAFVHKRFPAVKIVAFKKNYGFGGGNNRAVQLVKSDIVILFNNDIIPTHSAIKALLTHFRDPKVFAVACKQLVKTKKGEFSGGSAIAEFSRGLLRHKPATTSSTTTVPALFASGGAAAFDRKKFLALGGFDRLYAPFYWEDTDISARAWARGFKVLHEPASIVEHRHETTIKKIYPLWYVRAIGGRNMFLFTWRHLNGGRLWRAHFLWLPLHSVRRPLGFLMAAVKLPVVVMRRLHDKHHFDLAFVLGLVK